MKKFYIAETDKYGKGVFAGKNFKAGELLIPWNGQVYHYDQIDDNSYLDEHTLQIDTDIYMGPSGKEDDLINHSCDPNSYLGFIDGKLWSIVLKDIKKGEQVTWDYSTYILEDHWEMECLCGSSKCRKIVQNFDKLSLDLQQEYLKLDIVAPFIARKMNEVEL